MVVTNQYIMTSAIISTERKTQNFNYDSNSHENEQVAIYSICTIYGHKILSIKVRFTFLKSCKCQRSTINRQNSFRHWLLASHTAGEALRAHGANAAENSFPLIALLLVI